MNLPARRSVVSAGAPLFVAVLFTVLVTWPHSLYFATRVVAHHDPLFSMWRLAWVAHAIVSDPWHLFDANIFHPVANTLAFSDATLLEGLIAAPLFWIDVHPVAIYNLLLLGGIAVSGVAMYVLAREMVQDRGAALVAAAIFTAAPYRIEHLMHLELQWAMWVPLTFWAIHRSVSRGSWRYGALAGIFLWLQILSSVYYGVFLLMIATVLVLLLLVVRTRETARALPGIALGLAIAALLAAPYAIPYLQASRSLGSREAGQVATYSARLVSYLATPPESVLWGWTASRFGGPELSLFPGAITIVLAFAAALDRSRRSTSLYGGLALVTIVFSFGLNGPVYSWLFDHVGALRGFRAPARFGIIVSCILALLAAFGTRALSQRITPTRPGAVTPFIAALLVLIAIDNSTAGAGLAAPPYQPASAFNVYKTIRALGPGPIVELPLPKLNALPGREPTYEFWSLAHWHPMVNGYSGYYPQQFAETIVRMERFPDDRSLAQLAFVGARYIVVHKAFYEEEEYRNLIALMAARPELRPHGRYVDPVGECQLFVIER